MNWTDLKEKIYYQDGSYRDIYVLQTNVADWEIWIDYVNKNYRLDWFNRKTDKSENQIDFGVIKEFWSANHDLYSIAKVFIDKIQINAHFFDSTEMESDIDPSEFNSIKDHDKLIKYISDVSKLLDKELILTPENEPKTILFKVNKDDILFPVSL
ncbi:hypothetical protein HUW51_05040 [Adhaeribacter swui]|uniref:Uncharacterized protein n=1 Tax=Adhaeribacter swui TaxID=2086471 RepID=A0A7G7G4P1_9BACT|nr:hypothetical protein [Adhaeribacter swui]QNF32125.1 hypothetical protein HUW51_05040 [Adhaeribacter swui]